MVDSQCTETRRDLRRDIDVTDSEEYHVGKGIERAKSAGPILDDFDDAIEAFCDRVGESGSDEGQYAVVMPLQGVDKLAHGFQSASKGRCHPAPDEAFSRPRGFILPELLEFILELPCSVNAAIALVQRLQRACIFAGAS